MNVKIKSEKLTRWPIWGLYDSQGERVDFLFRQDNTKEGKDGLTKEELLNLLPEKGYTVVKSFQTV